MIRAQWSSIIIGVTVIALIAFIAGCGGGDGDGGRPPLPPGGAAEVAGTVVDATNVGTEIPGAQVELADNTADAPNALTDSNGNFTLEGVPSGGVTLKVSFPSTGAYRAMEIAVPTAAGETTFVMIAALPSDTTPPNAVTLSPSNVTIDLGGQVRFEADVRAFGVPVNIAPSFALLGNIGVLQPSGLFKATKIGKGTVSAHFETASATANVEVVGARPPRLGTLTVSPNNLPADGGQVRIAISATDGDGIADVVAEIENPDRSVTNVPLLLEVGHSRDGSWGGSFAAPPNSNPPSPDGVQLEQRYSVRVRVTDAGAASTLSGWADFTVAGLDPPPKPPDDD